MPNPDDLFEANEKANGAGARLSDQSTTGVSANSYAVDRGGLVEIANPRLPPALSAASPKEHSSDRAPFMKPPTDR